MSQTYDSGRVIKRRAAKACESCRARKVRCDTMINGTCCTNCKLDAIKCIVPSSQRGKGYGSNKQAKTHKRKSQSPHTALNPPIPTPVRPRDQTHENDVYLSPNPSESGAENVPACLTFDDDEVGARTEVGSEEDARPQDFEVQQCSVPASSVSIQTPIGITSLPSFIKPLPESVDSEDIEYLRKKGAFTIPPEDLCIEILRAYMLGIHPFMPILALEEFLKAVSNNGGDTKVSLLTFQAVMFAGLAHLPRNATHKTGYGTIKQARKDFSVRVRLLYALDTEPDNIAVLQSLLLMSFVYEKWNNQRHTWYWTGLALSLAQNIGLHRHANGLDISPQTQRLRKRLWWGLYIRDRLIGLGLRRPTRINDDAFDVPMLSTHDFDVKSFSVSFETHAGNISLGQDATVANLVALLCVELAKLCVCIGHILASQYTTLGEQTQLTRTMMVAPRSLEDSAQGMASCCEELDAWYQHRDPQVQNLAHQKVTSSSDGAGEVYWSLLHMIYQTSLVVLHRPHVLQSRSSDVESIHTQKLSREKVKAAARVLTKIAYNLYRCGQIHYIPTSGVPALLSASLGHMLNADSLDEDIRDASVFRFRQTMQILQLLRDVYASADSAMGFLALVARKAGLGMLMPPNVQSLVGRTSVTSPERRGGATAPMGNDISCNNTALITASATVNTNFVDPQPGTSGGIEGRSVGVSPRKQPTLTSNTLSNTAVANMLTQLDGPKIGTVVNGAYATPLNTDNGPSQFSYGNPFIEPDLGFYDSLSSWMADVPFLNADGTSIADDAMSLHYNCEYGVDALGLVEAVYGSVAEDEMILAGYTSHR